MPSLPNVFIPSANSTLNQNEYVPIQINRNETRTVRSTFVTSVNTNHTNLFPPSPPFTSYHASQVYSSTLTINSSRMASQTRSNMVSPVRIMPQISGSVNPHFSPVMATPTIPNMYHHATVPTNHMVTSQNGHYRGRRVITSGQTIWNHSPNVFGRVIPPTISNMYGHVMVPTNNMVTGQNGHERVITYDPTIHPPNVFNNQRETFYPEPIDYTKVDTGDEGGENKYRTHSIIPNENYGAYMCPKCHSLFDISPIISASNENNEEKEKGPCARTKKRCREPDNQDVNGKARKI